jgi:hypothetical protein
MRVTVSLVVLLLVSAPAWVSCRGNAQKSEVSSKHPTAKNEPLININGKSKMPTRPEIDVAKATLERLLPSFDRVEFESEDNLYTYISKKIGIPTRTSIQTTIFADSLIDEFFYFETDRAFHDHIHINIDKKSLAIIASCAFDDYLISGFTFERMLPFQKMQGAASRFIAANLGKKVVVRLQGNNCRHDFILNKEDREDICQTVELYDALMALKRAGIDPHTGDKVKPDDFPDHRP